MAATLLICSLVLLMLDALVEVGFVGSMVGFAHDRAGRSFQVNYPVGSSFELSGKPSGMLVNQGHTSNGAAGTAFVLVGIFGLLTMYYERSRFKKTSLPPHSSKIFILWTCMTILSALLTLSALIYTFIVTYQTANQSINLSIAESTAAPLHYPLNHWTPENWFLAILDLPLTSDGDRRDIRLHLRFMQGWRWNLIPLLFLGIVVSSLAIKEAFSSRRQLRTRSKLEYTSVKSNISY